MTAESFQVLLERVRTCRICEEHLPLGPRPIVRGSPSARLLIVGQAPGRRVHETGIPWNDPSGDRLRHWLSLTREEFYDESRIAIVPSGLCYPGRAPGKGGDLPPRPECAPKWHPEIRSALSSIRLTLLIGRYAQAFYLPDQRHSSLAELVERAPRFLPEYFPLPHPSPRNLNWFRRHPWFEADIVPELRRQLQRCFS